VKGIDPELRETARAVLAGGPTEWGRRRAAAEALLAAELAALPRSHREVLVVGGVRVHLFRPPVDGPLPVLLFAHGGGFTAGSAADLDRFCADIAARVDVAVANVDYRLVPYPGPVDDCAAVLRHLHRHTAELGLDPDRIAVGGSSSGAAVAASTVLRSRRHLPIAFQLLDVPALDDRLDTDSGRRSTATPGLTRAGMRAAWAAYLHGAASGDAVPARTHDLAGLPPTYVATAQLDPLRDEGIAYAQRLMAAGIRVELHCLPGTFHGSEVVAPTAAVSRRAAELRLRALAAGLGVAVDDRVRASARL